MVEVRDAHMITKSYLKAWADASGKVDVADLEDRQIRKASVKSATTVEYAYRPAVVNHDLEAEYGRIESQGLPVIQKLRRGEKLGDVGKLRLIAFLDMHLDRGRYADQANILTPAIALHHDFSTSEIQLNMSDRITLSRHLPEVERLTDQGMEGWEWEVRGAQKLITGDGAVLLWSTDRSEKLAGVTFPLSPTELLVIGPGLPGQPNLNGLVQGNSKRWLVGSRGQFVSEANRATRRAQAKRG